MPFMAQSLNWVQVCGTARGLKLRPGNESFWELPSYLVAAGLSGFASVSQALQRPGLRGDAKTLEFSG